MENYYLIAEWLGWPAVVAGLLIFFGFAAFLHNKNYQILKDTIAFLEKEVHKLEENSPDVLARRLADRYHLANEELERTQDDFLNQQEKYQDKNQEFEEVLTEIRNLEEQLMEAQEITASIIENNLLCPHCQAPLQSRYYPQVYGEYGGREISTDVEIAQYECGFETFEGKESSKCKNTATKVTDAET